MSDGAGAASRRRARGAALCGAWLALLLALPATGGDVVFADNFEVSCSLDSDIDRLPDCQELVLHQTDPLDPDTDGDGLFDGDEVLGSVDGLDLPALGANPRRRNVLIEYDWFDDALECAPHSHRPDPAVIAAVAAHYAAAPLANPDGSTGIVAIQDYGQGGPFSGGNLILDPDGMIQGTVFEAEYQAYAADHFAANRRGYFHYALLPHRYQTASGNNSSGYAEIVGDELMVSLYCFWGNRDYVANTVIHELGHNLGLRHGGDTECNFKSNYNSLMNYRNQFAGVDQDCDASPDGPAVRGYSSGTRLLLDENALDETRGVCEASPTPIDWNGNGMMETSVSHDLNAQDASQATNCGGVLSQLHDFDDWGYLNLGAVRAAARGGPREGTVCAAPPGVP